MVTEQYPQAATSSEKTAIKEELKGLVSRSLDAYIANLDKQITALEKSLEVMESTKTEYTRDRDEKIEERVNLYLGLP
jgi:hypothetical protein